MNIKNNSIEKNIKRQNI